MTGKSIPTAILMAILTAALHRPPFAAEPIVAKPTGPKPGALGLRQPFITISRETTFLTGPLTPEGFVDYAAAIDEHYSKGVTPENNAAVLLCKAFGLTEVVEADRVRLCKALALAPLPANGEYLVDQMTYCRRVGIEDKAWPPAKMPVENVKSPSEEALDQFSAAQARPWSRQEFPLVYSQLQVNQKPLQLVVEATRRSRFYVPDVSVRMACSGGTPFTYIGCFPIVQRSREAVRALIRRAMFHLKAGKIDDAWQDILACHRLGRLLSQGSTGIEHLVGTGLDGVAMDADLRLIHYANLSAETARRFAEELRRLPPVARAADKPNGCGRYSYLSTVASVAHNGPIAFLFPYGHPALTTHDIPLITAAWGSLLDWDEPLRIGNAWFDRLDSALAQPNGQKRRTALESLQRDTERMIYEPKDLKWIARNYLTLTPVRLAAGRHIGRMLLHDELPYSTWSATDHGLVVHSSVRQVQRVNSSGQQPCTIWKAAERSDGF